MTIRTTASLLRFTTSETFCDAAYGTRSPRKQKRLSN
jgi:hypothetical protein